MTRSDTDEGATLSVGRLATLAGVSVRTLHHYDAIGLLSPGLRSSAGYRVYGSADAARLQRILFYRELDLPLERIAELLDDPGSDEYDHLCRQHALIGEQIHRLQRVRAAVQTALEAHAMSIDLTPQERLEVFGAGNDPAQYDAEVRERWADTDAFTQSRGRTGQRSKEEWLVVQARTHAIEADFASALSAGIPADGPAAMDLAEQYRTHLSTSFHDMGHAMHRDVAAMYVDDQRFRKHFEDRAPGLAEYVRDAVTANAVRHGA